MAEALTRYVSLSDEATNLENHVVSFHALQSRPTDAITCQNAAHLLRARLQKMEQAIQSDQHGRALLAAEEGADAVAGTLQGQIRNSLCGVLDNQFGWFDITQLLDNDPTRWGLRLGSPARLLASPLSPAALLTLNEKELVLEGWDEMAIQPDLQQCPLWSRSLLHYPLTFSEVFTRQRTGSNSFRPQHNQTGERALKTARWCWAQGLQNVFNTAVSSRPRRTFSRIPAPPR